MWVPPSPAPPDSGWWVELSTSRYLAGVVAEARELEQAKRQRQLRRRVEKVDEQMCLASSASEARRRYHRQGAPFEWRSTSLTPAGEVERFTRAGQTRILSVR